MFKKWRTFVTSVPVNQSKWYLYDAISSSHATDDWLPKELMVTVALKVSSQQPIGALDKLVSIHGNATWQWRAAPQSINTMQQLLQIRAGNRMVCGRSEIRLGFVLSVDLWEVALQKWRRTTKCERCSTSWWAQDETVRTFYFAFHTQFALSVATDDFRVGSNW